MKKYVLFAGVFLLAFSLSTSARASLPEGCQAGYKFSATTGVSCTEIPTVCAPGALFSYLTGKPCGTTYTAPQQPAQDSTYEQDKKLVREYNAAIQEINDDIKKVQDKYYVSLANIQKMPIPLPFQEGRIRQLVKETYDIIRQLEEKKQELYREYLNKVDVLIPPQSTSGINVPCIGGSCSA